MIALVVDLRGIGTPETKLSRIGSHPGHAHQAPVYHNNEKDAQLRAANRPINIQDILKKRDNDLPAGLRMGGAECRRIGNQNVGSRKSEDQNKLSGSNAAVNSSSRGLNQGSLKQAEIDRKLASWRRGRRKNN